MIVCVYLTRVSGSKVTQRKSNRYSALETVCYRINLGPECFIAAYSGLASCRTVVAIPGNPHIGLDTFQKFGGSCKRRRVQVSLSVR